ncbi:MAG: DNA repair protein RecO [Proteobacteria bacterium]|nr:DNA repair protein RecO [Pseudomonadota bacterium]
MVADASSDAGYVLHSRRYRETSLIVEFLTETRGRVAAVARGALRRNSALAASLQPLVPLRLQLGGRGELMNLVRAEPLAHPPMLAGERLYCLFYVNELVMRLTASHDPNHELFEVYCATLAALAGEGAIEEILRRFEKQLLDALGFGLQLDCEAGGDQALAAEACYHYDVERGALPVGPEATGSKVHGATLLALAADEPLSPQALREAKQLMRHVLNHHLDGRPLTSRKLFEALAGGKP